MIGAPTVYSSGTAVGSVVTVANVVMNPGDFALIKAACRISSTQSPQTPAFGGSTAGVSNVFPVTVFAAGEAAAGVWKLFGPTGTADVTVDFGAAGGAMYAVVVEVYASTFKTGNQTSSQGATASFSDTIVNYVGGRVSDFVVIRGDDTLAADSGQQDTGSLGVGSGTAAWWSHEDGADSVTMGWSGNATLKDWIHIVIGLVDTQRTFDPLRTYRPRPYCPGSIR